MVFARKFPVGELVGYGTEFRPYVAWDVFTAAIDLARISENVMDWNWEDA